MTDTGVPEGIPGDPRLDSYRSLFDLTGRHALVIGAGGIGSEVALALAAHGAQVTAADLDREVARSTADACHGDAVSVDVTDTASVAELLTHGVPDVLVTTVGMNVRKPIADYSDDEFDRVITLNLRGVFTLLRAFGPAMAERGSGSFVAFSSIRAQTVEPGQGVYAASKAGLVQLLRTAAAEFGHSGVRFNAVAPGVVATELTGQIRADEAWSDAYAGKSALGRWARPSEMAGAAVFLASDASSFVTGSALFVDGGWTAIDGRFDPPL
ncbi:NAD(P)-dependent dehydrogenase (short-subunit alcohol dehydrogenase family) [Nakamurella sp. UYEF19]|uniref:SDR family NAD(P)-dependent oxidoreductase n=1 Tax=Nakamurella sp. UYEF19 TaxID=1756392 RepID=UPI0033970D04